MIVFGGFVLFVLLLLQVTTKNMQDLIIGVLIVDVDRGLVSSRSE